MKLILKYMFIGFYFKNKLIVKFSINFFIQTKSNLKLHELKINSLTRHQICNMNWNTQSVFFLLLLISEEAERITQSRGRVFCMEDEPGVYRVWMPNGKTPGLAISRAFGDHCMKDFGLISVPDVTHRKITPRDQFVILATDGVCVFCV